LTTIFLALADPTRRAILEHLRYGEASGTELARPFSISVLAISKHLRVLEHAELILHRQARVGGSVLFEVEDGSSIIGTYLQIVPSEKLVYTWSGDGQNSR